MMISPAANVTYFICELYELKGEILRFKVLLQANYMYVWKQKKKK